MKIKFDQIHTEKKQKLLKQMMHEINDKVLQIDNHNKKLNHCPICDSEQIKTYVKVFKFNMSICESCKLIFCNPYPNDEQLEVYYNSEMKSFENEFFLESFDARVNLFKPRIEIIKKYKTSGNLLDVGSAIGVFVEALSQNSSLFDVTCCDMSQEACKELSNRYPGYNVINDNFLNINTSIKYDIVSMWDTIEHIVDLNAMLNKVYSLLKNDGIFIFSTPNTKSFEWDIAKEKHVQLLPPGHVNLMNEFNIEQLLKNNSFKILDSYTLNASLDISYIKKLIKNNSINDNYIGQYLKDKIFDEEFEKIFEEYLVNSKQAGNIVIVARRSNA
jgi:2-polyprenyl-3-methyl-5-hydroxy-6-metoxy-1,4-benzoquinol methylase